MGRKGIDLVDVVRACVALNRQGRNLGPTNIRLELGYGSYSSIVRHLRRLALVDLRSRSNRWQASAQGRAQRTLRR